VVAAYKRVNMEFTLKNGKRILLWICSLICIFSSFSCEIHENSSELSESTIEKHIDKAFSFWQKPDSPGAAIVIIKNGKIFLKKGYGYANIEHDIPITTKTVFNIASLSKQFTAMAIALLAERGDLSLDDEIRKYLPEIPEAYE